MTTRKPVRPILAPMAEEACGEELASDPAMEGPEAIEVENRETVEDSHAEVGIDEEVEEAIKPLGLRDPGQSTQREIDEHELTHQPLRPWCDHCNKGRGQHDHHRALSEMIRWRSQRFQPSAWTTASWVTRR